MASMDDGSSDAFNGFESNEETDKDSIELELEKAVFGDALGFHERLKQHGTNRDGRIPSATHDGTFQRTVEDEVEDDFKNIADADVRYQATAVTFDFSAHSSQAIRSRFPTIRQDSPIESKWRSRAHFRRCRGSMAR